MTSETDRFVVATAGHVDHGKSTLVRALTGMEPDRWEQERHRGLTIDLGFAWTVLPSGREVSFVDVPGHERFLHNALTGLASTPTVCFVVAADQGWQPQSDDHRDAIAALGLQTALIVITRADLAEAQVDAVAARARREFSGTGLAQAPVLAVSARRGTGIEALREALDELGRASGDAPLGPTSAVRLWIDRAFTISGAGTVVTGTLTAGTVRLGQRLGLGEREVVVRGIQRQNESVDVVGPGSRVALNLRGVAVDDVHRGDVLTTLGAWHRSTVVDVRRVGEVPMTSLRGRFTLQVGTAAVSARVRPFDDAHARLTLDRALPLTLGDRLVVLEPGGRKILTGVRILDVDPPALTRRGDGTRRGAQLVATPDDGDLAAEVRRRGAAPARTLRILGLTVPQDPDDSLPAESLRDDSTPAGSLRDAPPRGAVAAGVRRIGDLLVDEQAISRWAQRLRRAVSEAEAREKLSAGLTPGAVEDLLELPRPARGEAALLAAVVSAADLEQRDGRIRSELRQDLGPAEEAVAALERRLAAEPFRSPEADELAALGCGRRELAAAEARGRLLRIADSVVLLPDAPARAMQTLAGFDGPFTASQARKALGTTRRTAIPLLEHLDSRGWTRRLDAGTRIVVR